ncbi:uncharacterized protein LOC130430460 [Triplophysa dalaica]|uniref:uncharacterized protein LOC130430460 n=1 Tax=Triplophysa dalaica TaxID=1582913 RepID=UPI0024DF6AAD|nr:uncharacterized protein LOC130430460 [Triplophysa dalaica]
MMNNMTHPLFILLFLLRLLCDVSCDGVQRGMDNTLNTDIQTPYIIRDYLNGSKCVVVCSVSSLPQANLTWYNGSNLYSSIMISDFNTKLYLEVEHQDKNNYSCVLSSTHNNGNAHLNVSLLCQSCSGGKMKMMPVSEGESVTLPTNLKERQKDMQWFYYGKDNSFIGKHFEGTTSCHKYDDGRFTNKLQVDNKTGSITINKISGINAGIFALITYQPQMDQLCYNVTVNDRTTMMSVHEEECAIIPTHLTEQNQDLIEWLYEEDKLIADLYKNQSDVEYDCRFKDRLHLDNKTGSLTITNISKNHSGLYKLKITKDYNNTKNERFNVTVYDHLSVPVIIRYSSQCSSSSERSSVSKCVLLCSVMNVTHVTLSWYKGNSLLNSISVYDLNIRLSLPLEVECHDNNTFSCVINSTFSSNTTQLQFNELCKGPSQQSNAFGVGIVVVGGVVVGGVLALLCWFWHKRRFPCQEDASVEHYRGRFNAEQANGASGQDTPDNRPNEESHLITSLNNNHMI